MKILLFIENRVRHVMRVPSWYLDFRPWLKLRLTINESLLCEHIKVLAFKNCFLVRDSVPNFRQIKSIFFKCEHLDWAAWNEFWHHFEHNVVNVNNTSLVTNFFLNVLILCKPFYLTAIFVHFWIIIVIWIQFIRVFF